MIFTDISYIIWNLLIFPFPAVVQVAPLDRFQSFLGLKRHCQKHFGSGTGTPAKFKWMVMIRKILTFQIVPCLHFRTFSSTCPNWRVLTLLIHQVPLLNLSALDCEKNKRNMRVQTAPPKYSKTSSACSMISSSQSGTPSPICSKAIRLCKIAADKTIQFPPFQLQYQLTTTSFFTKSLSSLLNPSTPIIIGKNHDIGPSILCTNLIKRTTMDVTTWFTKAIRAESCCLSSWMSWETSPICLCKTRWWLTRLWRIASWVVSEDSLIEQQPPDPSQRTDETNAETGKPW